MKRLIVWSMVVLTLNALYSCTAEPLEENIPVQTNDMDTGGQTTGAGNPIKP